MDELFEGIGKSYDDAETLSAREEQYFQERQKQRDNLQRLQQLVSSTEQIVTAVNEGWIDSTEAYGFFSAVIESATNARKEILETTTKDLIEPQVHFGYQLSTRKSAGRWKYTDADYVAAKTKLKTMEENRKAAYKVAQGDSPATIIDPDTGEIVPPAEFTEGSLTVVVKKTPSS